MFSIPKTLPVFLNKLWRGLLAAALLTALLATPGSRPARAYNTTISSPPGSVAFGLPGVLPNGNLVVRDFEYAAGGAANAGAVYLYDGATFELISTLTGSTAGDQIGSGGITILSNGNYLVLSPQWDNGANADAGAITWCSATTGCKGIVGAANSLVGNSSEDRLDKEGGIRVLSNGNYLVSFPEWDNGAVANVGAVTWCSGTSGCQGPVSTANSLVGSTAEDMVGYDAFYDYSSVVVLNDNNYLVISSYWDNGAAADAGAATWCNGTTGCRGTISAANSLVGSSAEDWVGNQGAISLSNGNYVVSSPDWDNGAIIDVGAATWCSGTSGCQGMVGAANSLIGSQGDDSAGSGGISALNNGNYVVNSPDWDNGATGDTGAATWCSGASGCQGAISTSDSLVGQNSRDFVGNNGAVALSNGNYVVLSSALTLGDNYSLGAVTWGNGLGGTVGVVSAANSLIGSTSADEVGSGGVIALNNGNYVVRSPRWNNGASTNAGAITWGNGLGGTVGVVSAANSLVGSSVDDQAGADLLYNSKGVIALNNGNYVVHSLKWDSGALADVGAVTWCGGTGGCQGAISASNSLVGGSANDQVGSSGIKVLSNNNYVVLSRNWANAGAGNSGAATWCSGTSGCQGTVSTANSLVGSAGGGVGWSAEALNNGNYVVHSILSYFGAVTWCSGTSGCQGTVSAANSLVGSMEGQEVGSGGIFSLSNGSYVVGSPYGYTQGAGAVTWCSGTSGCQGAITADNSLVGSTTGDAVSVGGLQILENGNYLIFSPYWDNGAVIDVGEITYGRGNGGTKGTVSAQDSVWGVTASGGEALRVVYNPVYEYIAVGRTLSGNNGISIFRPIYTAVADGDWEDAATWDYGAFSQPQDVHIPAGRSVTLNTNASVRDLQLDGQLSSPTGVNLTINGALERGTGSTSHETHNIDGTGLQTFPVAGLTVNVKTPGSMTSLLVQRSDSAHPQENAGGNGAQTPDHYYTLTPNAGGYQADLCSSYTAAEISGLSEDSLQLCRWDGAAWVCAARGASSSASSNQVCADGISAFSDWVITGTPGQGAPGTLYLPLVRR